MASRWFLFIEKGNQYVGFSSSLESIVVEIHAVVRGAVWGGKRRREGTVPIIAQKRQLHGYNHNFVQFKKWKHNVQHVLGNMSASVAYSPKSFPLVLAPSYPGRPRRSLKSRGRAIDNSSSPWRRPLAKVDPHGHDKPNKPQINLHIPETHGSSCSSSPC
ncbi:hypothetical protein CPB86DRAFT_801974 [Serendipita vermifera]|nr:hypothetical protein CPB86DRAFT_801974 [Serendipita vermifera]